MTKEGVIKGLRKRIVQYSQLERREMARARDLEVDLASCHELMSIASEKKQYLEETIIRLEDGELSVEEAQWTYESIVQQDR